MTGVQTQQQEQSSFSFLRRIKLTNAISLVHFSLSLPYLFFFLYKGYTDLAFIVLPILAGYASPLLFNKLKLYTIAKYWLIVLSHIAVYYFALSFGPGSGIHYIFIVFFCMPFLLFEFRETWNIFFSMLYSVLIFFSYHFNLVEYEPIIDAATQQDVYISVIFFIYVLLGGYCYAMVSINDNIERMLEENKQKLEQEMGSVIHIAEEANISGPEGSNVADILKSQIRKVELAKNLLQKERNDLTGRLKEKEQALARETALREQLEKEKQQNEIHTDALTEELIVLKNVVGNDFRSHARAMLTLSNWIKEDYSGVLDAEGLSKLGLLSGRIEQLSAMITEINGYINLSVQKEVGTTLDLSQFLPYIFKTLKPPSNISIQQEELPVVIAGKGSMEIIFRSILKHCIHQAAGQDMLIHVSCISMNGSWKFAIHDNGPAIDEKFHRKIFEPFFNLGRQEQESGGIGLAMVRKTVEKYGGTIWVESRPDKGTTFYFTLPRNSTQDKDIVTVSTNNHG
jgi:signal transduction histidine kinase